MKTYLIDCSAYLFRAYYSLPPMTGREGEPTGAVYGFTTMVLDLLHKGRRDATHIAAVFDYGRRTFRTEMYPQYKAHRPPVPDDLRAQFSVVRDAARALGLAVVEVEGFEADDVIATYSRLTEEADGEALILSSDKDLMQLVRLGVTMFDPLKKRHIGPCEVREKFGVWPHQVVDAQALIGDTADNIPGVPKIGVKTAAELLNAWGDLDALLANAGSLKLSAARTNLIRYADQARLSRALARLHDDAPVPPLEALAVRDPNPDELLEFLDSKGFEGLRDAVAAKFGRMEPCH